MKSRRVADRNTVYRIGSITKPFTAVMLMQLLNAGKIRLSDPVEKYFPEIKQVGGMPPGAPPVTFLQLATMTAGLAREPREEGPFWTGPVASWEQTLISALPHTSYETVSRNALLLLEHRLRDTRRRTGARRGRAVRQVGTHARARAARHEADAIRDRREHRIGRREGLPRRIETARSMATRRRTKRATGRGYKVPNGAIFTTVDDLSRFVAFELGQRPGQRASFGAIWTPAFGGFVASEAGDELRVWPRIHGHASRHVHVPRTQRRRGRLRRVDVLRPRSAGGRGAVPQCHRRAENPDRLAVDILSRLVDATKQHRVVSVDPKVFDGYVGRYQLAPNFIMAVTREGNQLFTQATGQQKIEVFPEGERDFFVKVFDAQMTFETDGRGRATAMVLHQGGATVRAKRID